MRADDFSWPLSPLSLSLSLSPLLRDNDVCNKCMHTYSLTYFSQEGFTSFSKTFTLGKLVSRTMFQRCFKILKILMLKASSYQHVNTCSALIQL